MVDHIWNIVWDTYEEAAEVQAAYPTCAMCSGSVKIQHQEGRWWLRCIWNPTHRGVQEQVKKRRTKR